MGNDRGETGVSHSTFSVCMSSSVRDGIEEKLSQESNLAGCVSKLFQFVPAHLVPVDEHVVKANVILDRLCFHMLTQRLLGNAVTRKRCDELFDELDVDATGFLSLAEIVRRIQRPPEVVGPFSEEKRTKKSPRPGVTDSEVVAAQQQLQGKLAALVAQDNKLVSAVVMLFERVARAGEITHRRGKVQVLNMGEFHHMLVRMLHIPVSRETSDGLFAKIVGLPVGVVGDGEMSVNEFIAAAMPPAFEKETWYDVRRSEMAKVELSRKNPQASFNDHVPAPPVFARATFGDQAQAKLLRTKIGDQLARLTSADSQILQTMVKIFMSADPKAKVSHLTPKSKRRCISCDEFHHVLTRILMIPCTSMEAGAMFHSYEKADSDNLTLEEFVHQSMPPEYTVEQWNLRRELIMRKGREWTDDAAGVHHKRHSLHIQRATAGMSVKTLVSVHGTNELAHSVRQRLQANAIDSVDGINHIVRLFLLVGTDKPQGNRLLGGELGDGCTAMKICVRKPGFYELITGRLNVFCQREIVDDWFDTLAQNKSEITAMEFAERVFGKKKYDPRLLLKHSKVCLSGTRSGLLPQEGIPDKEGKPMFGYGISARENTPDPDASTDGVKANDTHVSEHSLPAASRPRKALELFTANECPKIATPVPFGNSEPPVRAIATADSARSSPRVPNRPAHSRSSRLVIRKPVVTHKKYLRKSDLPKHLLFKAMHVHANNLL